MATMMQQHSSWLWTAIGALLGVSAFITLFESSSTSGAATCQKVSGVTLAQLTAQPKQYYQQPSIEVKSSKPLFREMEDAYAKTYFMPCGKSCHATQRALRSMGWSKANEIQFSRVVFTANRLDESQEEQLQSWQRYSHLPITNFVYKNQFLNGIAAYKDAHGSRALQFLPSTYRLYNDKERASLERVVQNSAGKIPWIKLGFRRKSRRFEFVKAGKDMKLLLQEEDKTAMRVLQQYVCDQMRWNGQEFVVRVFWFVASLDPLIVLYQDGYARIGHHRGNISLLKADDEDVSFNDFEAFVNQEALKNRQWRRRKLDVDPIDHVRNQFKEALATVVDVFRDVMKPQAGGPEDAFSVFAADFIVDQELDVWLAELYHHEMPNGNFKSYLLEDYYFLLEKNHELWYGMGLTLEEVWSKQQRHVNILPLQTTGKWELIVAGEEWKYEYNQERKNEKKSKSCKIWRNEKENDRAVVREQDEEEVQEEQEDEGEMSASMSKYDDDNQDATSPIE